MEKSELQIKYDKLQADLSYLVVYLQELKISPKDRTTNEVDSITDDIASAIRVMGDKIDAIKRENKVLKTKLFCAELITDHIASSPDSLFEIFENAFEAWKKGIK